MSLSDEFAQTGTNSFLVRWEGNNDLSRAVQRIKALGKQVGVAVNPATAAGVLEEIIQDLDQVLIMTVNPGFGHQHFLYTMLPKIKRARQTIDQVKPGCHLEVDGGIDAKRPRSRLRAEPKCWLPDRRFSITTKASPLPWNGCGRQHSSDVVHARTADRVKLALSTVDVKPNYRGDVSHSGGEPCRHSNLSRRIVFTRPIEPE
jgi:hypothetical protein